MDGGVVLHFRKLGPPYGKYKMTVTSLVNTYPSGYTIRRCCSDVKFKCYLFEFVNLMDTNIITCSELYGNRLRKFRPKFRNISIYAWYTIPAAIISVRIACRTLQSQNYPSRGKLSKIRLEKYHHPPPQPGPGWGKSMVKKKIVLNKY